MMRIDKYLTATGTCTRSEAAKAIRRGTVTVDGRNVKSPSEQIDPERAEVIFEGTRVIYRRYIYLMMNKPEGVVSATEDGDRTVIDLLPENLRRMNLFPCGRLDKYTVGFILLTNNGPLGHYLLSPKHHVEKKYRFTAEKPLSDDDLAKLAAGVDIGGYTTAPCKVSREGTGYEITLTEGKYHQIKRMVEKVGSKVTFLERVSFGSIELDRSLGRGEWRYLTDEETKLLESWHEF